MRPFVTKQKGVFLRTNTRQHVPTSGHTTTADKTDLASKGTFFMGGLVLPPIGEMVAICPHLPFQALPKVPKSQRIAARPAPHGFVVELHPRPQILRVYS